MSALLTVGQAGLAVSRICIEGGFLGETAATGKLCKRLGFQKRFSGIVVSETRDNRQA
ncbi:hypothetical protein GGD66_002297 [Bradyrhizobium sp. CIR48]|uniref:hypothetical protein n=1 Tax=Bradyrhizobium sp. CIR48 TaxID=2663840 RepID=UPI001605BE1E|nr:hypothetical protein [Bradyrhizobium sp. CIR48]MBB4423753.1 hypothetical protein [Bradyrhizobium sp. CIR48]